MLNLQKTLTHLLTLLVFLILTLKLIHPAVSMTQDLGRHFKLGEIITQSKSVPKTNLFTFSNQNFPFVNHHWGSEVIFYHLYNLGGVNLLIIIKVLLLISSFALVFYLCKKTSTTSIAALLAALFLPIYLERTHIRPEIFSFFLFSLTLYILLKIENWKLKIWLLPLILLLWVNLHIYFAAGLALVTFFVFDQLIKKQNIKENIILILASYLVILINPNGIDGALLPLNIFKTYGYSIIENQTPFFLEKVITKPNIIPFKFSLSLTIPIIIYYALKKQLFAFLSSLFFTLLSLRQIRNFPLYALTMTSLAGIPIHKIFSLKQLSNLKIQLSNLLLVLAILITSISFYNSNLSQNPQKIINRQPVSLGEPIGIHQAFNFFTKQNLKGPIFNNFDIGGLAIYHLYPKHLLFVDNRPEAFPSQFFQQIYIPMQQNPQIFNQVNDQYHFQTIIFTHQDITPWGQKFLKTITQDPNWSIIFLNNYAVILVNRQNNPHLVEKFAITSQNATVKLKALLNTSNLKTLIRLKNFFTIANWPEPLTYTNLRLNFLSTKL